MSTIIETTDLLKYFLDGIIQGIVILIDGIFAIGYPLNLILIIMIVGTPVAAFIKSR